MTQDITAIRAFIEAARSGSFTRAAESLCVSQSAISKRIQSLEDSLGVPLFIRAPGRLKLSPAGDAYLSHASDALAMLETGRKLAREIAGQHHAPSSLEVAASPAFAAHWLIDRLPGFRARHPGTFLSVRPRWPDIASSSERFDIEIRLGAGRWPNARATHLLGREMALVGSPSLLQNRRIRSVHDLQGMPLLRRAQRGYDWQEWAAAVAPGWTAHTRADMVFEGFSVLIPAIRTGLGLGICPLFMVLDDLLDGRLVRPLGEQVLAQHTYHAVLPQRSGSNTSREHFLGWLQDQANDTQQALARYLNQ